MPISFVHTPQHYMNACAPSEAGWDTCPSPSHASGTWIEPHDAASSTVVFWGDSVSIELYAATLCRLRAAGTSKYYAAEFEPQLLNLTQEATLLLNCVRMPPFASVCYTPGPVYQDGIHSQIQDGGRLSASLTRGFRSILTWSDATKLILIPNLGVHFSANDGTLSRATRTLLDAFDVARQRLATVATLRLLWRETPAQHFSTPGGVYHYEHGSNYGQCSAIREARDEFNAVTNPLVESAGHDVLRLWNASVPRWDSHFGNGDCTHYCLDNGVVDQWVSEVMRKLGFVVAAREETLGRDVGDHWDRPRAVGRAVAVNKWLISSLLNNGSSIPEPPKQWVVKGAASLEPRSSWTLLAHGLSKSVYHTRLRPPHHSAPGQPVVVKTCVGDGRRELLLLEYLQGLNGIPTLLGAWFEADGGMWWAVTSRGSATTIGITSGITSWGSRLTHPILHANYLAMAREHPSSLALALLDCFRSFAERGKLFLIDLHPLQFVAGHSSQRPTFELIDFHLIERPEAPMTQLTLSPLSPLLATERRCSKHAHCLHFSQQCCCGVLNHSVWVADSPGDNRICAAGTPPGAPEARYPCQATHGALAISSTFCHRLTAETHAYDVATKPWLLPLMAQRSEAVRELLPLMAASLPHERLTFSQAIAWLQHRLRTGGHNGGRDRLA